MRVFFVLLILGFSGGPAVAADAPESPKNDTAVSAPAPAPAPAVEEPKPEEPKTEELKAEEPKPQDQKAEEAPAPAAPPEPEENVQSLSQPIPYSGQMGCAQDQLLKGTKAFERRYYNDKTGSSGDCGGGVGDALLSSGFDFIRGPGNRGYTRAMLDRAEREEKRLAYKFMDYLPEFGFQRIDITDPLKAPPGSILVYAGDCPEAHYRRPDSPRGPCRSNSPGDWVGHVTIAGGPGKGFYTDGITQRPAIAHRTLIGVFIPGKKLEMNCRISNNHVSSQTASASSDSTVGQPTKGSSNAVR